MTKQRMASRNSRQIARLARHGARARLCKTIAQLSTPVVILRSLAHRTGTAQSSGDRRQSIPASSGLSRQTGGQPPTGARHFLCFCADIPAQGIRTNTCRCQIQSLAHRSQQRLRRWKGSGRCAEIGFSTINQPRQAARQPVCKATKVLHQFRPDRNGDFGGAGRRRCAAVRDKINPGRIGFVTDSGNQRNMRMGCSTNNDFFIETPEVLDRAAPAGDDQQRGSITRHRWIHVPSPPLNAPTEIPERLEAKPCEGISRVG